jgi:hypothetical protein
MDETTMSNTAERLRRVRQAHERFLAMAALDCIMDGTARISLSDMASDDTDREGADRAETGPDWVRLFRAGVLDD